MRHISLRDYAALPMNAEQSPNKSRLVPTGWLSALRPWWSILSNGWAITLIIVSAWFLWFDVPWRLSLGSPILADTKNGTYRGVYSSSHHQYHFLGMPYGLPPLGDGRFRPPRSINTSWQGERRAESYGPHCIGYGHSHSRFPQSEDCLTINVIRPVQQNQAALPVAAYIYGGRNYGGGTGDEHYNLSFIVSHAAKVGLPFIGVSFNYRSSLWGFISSKEVVGTRNSNLGLHDQRLALHWIQENIAAFGGDPNKVTLWGSSSGAENVGMHLTAFGGRDDGLFRAAILQGGNSIAVTGNRHMNPQTVYKHLTTATGCNKSADSLNCLRHLPFSDLNDAFDDSPNGNSTQMEVMSYPTIDGNIVAMYGSISIEESHIVRVPILSGVVSNQLDSWIPANVSSAEDIQQFLINHRKYPVAVVRKLLDLYTESERGGLLTPSPISANNQRMYDTLKIIVSDLDMNAAHRFVCSTLSRLSTCFSYRFDAVLYGNASNNEARYGADIASALQSTDVLGFDRSPFIERGNRYYDVSRQMGTLWAGFITHLNPNTGISAKQPQWPHYSVNDPRNIVFSGEEGLWIERDIYREKEMAYINSIQQSVLDK